MPRTLQSHARAGRGRSPRRGRGRGPTEGACRSVIVLLACALPAAVGCSNPAADQVTRPVALGMTDKIAPFYSDGQITLYQVQIAVPLPVRQMNSGDVKAAGAAPAGTPYPRGVFLRAQDESVEVRFTLTNLDTTDHDVWLLIDPWNEFVRWKPGVTVVDDEESVPNFGYDKEYTVPAMQRLEGTITADDMHEIGIKLASVENMLASPQAQAPPMPGNSFDPTQIANNIFNPQNRSNSVPPDLLYTPWIPPVIAGVTGFDLGLRTSESANVAVEIIIDVQDLKGNRFVEQDSTDPEMGPPPMTLSPPGARF